jgi:MFS family permease
MATDSGTVHSLSGWPSALRALRHRNFRLFFGGQLISLIGTWMQIIAQSWLVYRLTGSAILLGLIGFCSQIPVLVVSPLGGTIADRYHRHRIIVIAQATAMLLAFVLALLTLTNHVRIWHVFVLSAALGLVNAFDIPARQSFFIEMVGRDDLMNAIALNASMFNSARIIGPAVAGILVARIGEGWCFLANAVSYMAVLAGLCLMSVPPPSRSPVNGSALASIREGFEFAWRMQTIRSLLLLLGILSLAGMPYVVLMPIFADQVLHGGAKGLGLLMGASGLGALLGALTVGSRHHVHGLGRWAALAAVGFGVSLIVFSLSRSFWLSAAMLLPAGFSMMVEMAASNTLIQTMVPDELRGRVMSIYLMMFMGMAPFGALLAGLCAQNMGAPTTVALGGVVCIAGALVLGPRLVALHAEVDPPAVSAHIQGK